MVTKRKRSTDYPQYTFRVDAETKDMLSKLIEKVAYLYNKSLEPDDYVYRKNNIIIEAWA